MSRILATLGAQTGEGILIMRTLLLLGTGFWLFVAVTISSIAYALAAACLLLLGADFLMRLSNRRVKRLDRRLERWYNPVPLPETRGTAIKPRLVHAETKPAGRSAGASERNSVKEIKPIRTEVRRGSRSASVAKHPGQDSNLQPAD